MIGLDAVDIQRFEHWSNYSIKQLEKVFHLEEIAYALSSPKKTAERLAARFAAKEAFYKALCAATNKEYSLISIFKNVRVDRQVNGAPFLVVNRVVLDLNRWDCKLTITHTNKTAIALVMLSITCFN